MSGLNYHGLDSTNAYDKMEYMLKNRAMTQMGT